MTSRFRTVMEYSTESCFRAVQKEANRYCAVFSKPPRRTEKHRRTVFFTLQLQKLVLVLASLNHHWFLIKYSETCIRACSFQLSEVPPPICLFGNPLRISETRTQSALHSAGASTALIKSDTKEQRAAEVLYIRAFYSCAFELLDDSKIVEETVFPAREYRTRMFFMAQGSRIKTSSLLVKSVVLYTLSLSPQTPQT